MPSIHVTEDKAVLDELITFMATKMILRGEFNHLIDHLIGLNSPYASYFLFECYRRLSDNSTTPKKKQKCFKEKASMYFRRCSESLESFSNHPLKWMLNQHESDIVDDVDRCECCFYFRMFLKLVLFSFADWYICF